MPKGIVMEYEPNSVPRRDRVFSVGASIFLLAYGGYGAYVNDLYIPGKRSKGVHLHDAPVAIMCGAFLCACFVLISVVIDHYDTRNNEHDYHVFAKFFKYLGWGLFGASLVAHFLFRSQA